MADGTYIAPANPNPNRYTSEYVQTLRTRIDAIKAALPEPQDSPLVAALDRIFHGVERGYVIANSHTREPIADRIATGDITIASRMLEQIRPSNSTPNAILEQATALYAQTARDFGLTEKALSR